MGVLIDGQSRKIALKGQLHSAQDVWEFNFALVVAVDGSEEGEDEVSRRVREQLQVVGTVLVVGGDEEGHQVKEELLATALVTEEGIPVYDVQLAFARVGQSFSLQRHWLSGIQQQ